MRRPAAPARRITATEAAALVRPGMWLDYGAGLAQPDVFDQALAARRDALSGVRIRACLTTRPRAVIEADPEQKSFCWISSHFSAYERRKHDAGLASYLPVNLGEVPDYYRRFIDPPDIVILKCRPPDAQGWCSFGPANLWHRALVERARCLIVETSAAVPYCHGTGNGVHLSEIDWLTDGDDQPLPELPNPPPSEVDRAVAGHILSQIEEGACLQIGIGGMPNAVCALLAEATIPDLGIHSEMLTDGICALYRAGRITGARKQLYPGRIVYSFALGSRALYDMIDGNQDFLCEPVDVTNLPHSAMRNHRLTAINNTTQIDLQGQAASESDGLRHISGTGGQLQFVRAAYASEGGKSFICLASTYDRKGERRSRIVLSLTRGNIVTTPRTDMMYVATEYGIVNLKGKSVPERARALIGLAHPDFREELERQAHEHRLIPRGYF